MNTTMQRSFFIFFFVTSYLVGMESDFNIEKVPPTHAHYHRLWMVTSDDKLVRFSKKFVRHCLRLQLGCRLYPDNSRKNPIKKIRFTKKNMRLLQKTLKNPQCVTARAVNTVMTMAESFGAYVLYAYYVNKLSENLDKNLIVPLLKIVSNRADSDQLLSALFSAQDIVTEKISEDQKKAYRICSKNRDYYVCRNMHSPRRYVVYNWKHEECYQFKSSEEITLHGKPCLLKKSNFILYYNEVDRGENQITAKLYDLDNQQELWSCVCYKVIISDDERYLAVYQLAPSMVVCNLENPMDIKKKTLCCGQQSFYWNFIFSPGSTQLIANIVLLDDQDEVKTKELVLWNMSDFMWNNEGNYVPFQQIKIVEKRHSIKSLNCDSTGRYCFITYYNAISELIDLSTNTSTYFRDGFFIPEIDLIVCHTDSDSIEIYRINDLSHSLYSYKTSGGDWACQSTENKLYINIHNAFWNYCYVLLKYNKDNNSIVEIERDIKGSLRSISKRGWCIFKENGENKYFFYDNNGRRIARYSPKEGVGEYPKFLPDQNGIDILRGISFPLYTQDDERTCDALWSNVNCAQYALLNAIYSDVYHRNECGAITFKKHSLENAVLDTFQVNAEEKKSYLCDRLKITIT